MKNKMTLVAWLPPDVSADPELIAVLVPPGVITHSQWIDALADRVTNLAVAEVPELTAWASRYLGSDVGYTDDPQEAGECFVLGNWTLQEHLSVAMYNGDPFPCVAAEDEGARDAIENSDFQLWIELAHAMTSPN